MVRTLMHAKLHGARVTEANLSYEGSITIDRELMDAVGLLPNERVQVVNKNNANRFETYVIEGVTYRVMETSEGYREEGLASWYGGYFHGRQTSSGDVYDMYLMTAAHKSLPLPTYVRVTNLANGRAVVLRVNDRGPFVDDRIIDLSFTAATKLGMAEQGTARVEVVALDPPARDRTP